jgi:hypothetical protein
MHAEFLQSLRYKLQKRIRRLKSSDWQRYILALRQFWTFFDSEPTLVAVAEKLQTQFPNAATIATDIVQQLPKGTFPFSDNEGEWAAVGYRILRQFAEEGNPGGARKYVPMQSGNKLDDYLNALNAFYLDPFYEYVDESLDDPRFILAHLIRFKHLCEWFWRTELFNAWSNNPSRGEKLLAIKLYEFLYTEGIHIHIEPSSISGEADMVGSQPGPERLIADAKIFNPDKSKGKPYIVQGFRQVYQYAADYNEPVGYLVIFNTTNKQLRFAVPGAADPLPHVTVNHKTIFFVVIDIYQHETTASKRPQPEVIEITEAEIVGAATEPEIPAPETPLDGPGPS